MKRVHVAIVAVKKAVNITCSEYAFVALVIQHATGIISAPCYVVICGLPGSTVLFDIIL